MTNEGKSGLSTLTILGLIFVTLKLMGHIDWSWWWVTLPFYGPLLIVVWFLFGRFLYEFCNYLYTIFNQKK